MNSVKYQKAKSTKYLLRTVENADYSQQEIQNVFVSFWKSKGYEDIETFMIEGRLEIYGLKKQLAKYYRARIALIKETIPKRDDIEKKLYSNGFIPKNQQKEFHKQVFSLAKKQSNEALKFEELTSFSTWFTMHPEKIAGQEIPTTSRAFPLKTKGTKADIENMFDLVFSSNKNIKESEAEAIAIALQLELELMDL